MAQCLAHLFFEVAEDLWCEDSGSVEVTGDAVVVCESLWGVSIGHAVEYDELVFQSRALSGGVLYGFSPASLAEALGAGGEEG